MPNSLPAVDPPAHSAAESDSRIAGCLLAAGTSSRFGDANKLLIEVDGEPIVHRAARSLVDSTLDPVVVVLGHDADRVRDALADLPVSLVVNPDYAAGQSTSVSAGVEAVAEEPVDAVLIALGDMPDVSTETIDTLVASYDAGVGDVLAAAYEGQRGNPALFDAAYFDELRDLSGDVGARSILLEAGTCVETGDPGVLRDVDEPGEERLTDRA